MVEAEGRVYIYTRTDELNSLTNKPPSLPPSRIWHLLLITHDVRRYCIYIYILASDPELGGEELLFKAKNRARVCSLENGFQNDDADRVLFRCTSSLRVRRKIRATE